MAGERGVRWLIQWINDQASRAKVAQEGRETADQVGNDFKQAGQQSAGLFQRAWSAAIQAVKSPLGQLGTTIAGLWSVGKILAFGRASVLAAADSEAAWGRLDGTLRTVGTTLAANRRVLEAGAAAFQRRTVFDDEAFISVLQDLVSISGDYARSLTKVGLVADFAAARHLDLSTAALIVGKAMVGETGTLARYGIVVKEGGDALEVMRKKFAGMAENETKTFDGQMKQLSNEWQNFKEALGGALITVSNGRSLLSQVTGAVRDLTTFVERNKDEWVTWSAILLAVFKSLALPIRMAFNLGQAIAEAMNLSGAGIALVADKILDLIPGIDRTQQIAEDTFLAAKAQHGLMDALNDSVGAIEDVGAAWKGVASAAAEAAKEQNKAVAPDAAVDPIAEKLKSFGSTDRKPMTIPKVRARRLKIDQVGAAKRSAELDALNAQMAEVEKRATTMAENMTDGFARFFESLADGEDVFHSLGDAARGVGASIVAGLTEGMAEYHLAQAVGKLAEGTWPPNPLAIASAAKHAAAAALFKGVAALVAGHGRSGGSSGASGAGLGGGASIDRDRVSDRMSGGASPTFIFNIDTSDPLNPVWQEAVKGAYDNARERLGNATIEVFPMSRARTG